MWHSLKGKTKEFGFTQVMLSIGYVALVLKPQSGSAESGSFQNPITSNPPHLNKL